MQEKVYISGIGISDNDKYNFSCSFNEDAETTDIELEIFDRFFWIINRDFEEGTDELTVYWDEPDMRISGNMIFSGLSTKDAELLSSWWSFSNEDNETVFDHYYFKDCDSSSNEYKYNDSGEKISTIRRSNGIFESESIYNTEGNIKTDIFINEEHIMVRKVVTENTPGKVVTIEYDKNDIIKSIEESKMDDDGNVVSINCFDGEGNLLRNAENSHYDDGRYERSNCFDVNGNILSKTEISVKNDFEYRLVYCLYENGNLIRKEDSYHNSKSETNKCITYYENGKIVKTIINEGICKSYADILLDCFEDELLNKCFVNMRLTFDKLSSGQIF